MNFFKREQWRLVATISDPVLVPVRDSKRSGVFIYHLFESSKRSRKVKIVFTDYEIEQDKVEKFARASAFYNAEIYPWLVGRNFPNISKYDDIPEEETVLFLKGAIEEKV